MIVNNDEFKVHIWFMYDFLTLLFIYTCIGVIGDRYYNFYKEIKLSKYLIPPLFDNTLPII